MIKVRNVTKKIDNLEVLKGVDLSIEKGQVISVIGPSGSGKTTLLRCMNYLTVADTGEMEFDGVSYDMAKTSKKDIEAIRKKTGFVFQSYNLFLNKTALENVTEGLIVARKMSKDKAKEIAMSALRKVGMEDRTNHYPSQLSGGQQQRVAIARALALNPEIIYFDEPTSALDPELIGEVNNVIKELANEKMTMIIVTHEMNFARSVSDKIMFMDEGRVIEEGTPDEIFNHPKEKRVKEFLEAIIRS